VQLPVCWRLLGGGVRPRLGPRVEGLRDVLVAWTPVVFGAGIAQVSGLVDTVLGSLIGEGAVASLAYAQTLQILPVSLFGMSVAAVALPDLSRDAAGPDAREALRARLAVGFRRVVYFVVPSAFAFAALGPTLVAGLFQTGRFNVEDAQLVGGVLAAYGIGLLGAASIKLFASGFYALRDTRTPVLIGVASLVVSTSLAIVLMRPLGAAGIALAASVGGLLNLLVHMFVLQRRVGVVLGAPERRALISATAAALAAAVSGVAAVGATALLGPVLRALVAAVAFGAVYLLGTLLARHPEAIRLWTSLRASRAS
jgi:putative peptidoglycan lipid II flippase